MNIKKIDQEISPTMTGNKGKKVNPDNLDFKQILQGLTETNPAAPATEPAELAKISPFSSLSISAINFLPDLTQAGRLRSQSVQATENTLDLLEQYQKALGDPRISLKKIDGLVRSLSRESKELTQLSEEIPTADPLKKIMSEVGLVSTVEVEKFDQGRYI